MDTGVGRGGVTLPSKYCVAEILAQMLFTYPLCAVYVGQVLFFVYFFSCLFVACENIRFSSLFAAGDVSRGGKRPQRRRAKRNGCFRRPALFNSCYLWRVRVGNSIPSPRLSICVRALLNKLLKV